MSVWIDKFKRWARRTPLAIGPLPDGSMEDALGCQSCIIVIDARGRIFQLQNANINHGTLAQVHAGRTSLLSLMNEYNVQDFSTIPGDG